MTDKLNEAFTSFWLGEGAEDVTSTDIQEAFDNEDAAKGEGASWDYSITGPSPNEINEQFRFRRERLVALALPYYDQIGIKGVIDIAAQLEEYVNG